MQKNLAYLLFLPFFFSLIFGCQRELNFDTPPPDPVTISEGTLIRDGNGDCLPVKVAGTYSLGKQLGDTNYLEVQLRVGKIGAYLLTTETKDGYTFKGEGKFSDTGLKTVRLIGSGKPTNTGIYRFAVTYNSTTCNAYVTVNDSAPPPNPQAQFSLQGQPNTCLNYQLLGSFVKGYVLDTSNKINIVIDVSSPGLYNVSTNTVNGYSFSSSGILSSTGIQTIALKATGTPVNAGTDAFVVTGGTSTCNFPVTVLNALPVTNADYFPLTSGSYWTYNDLRNTGDSIRMTIIGTIVTNNQTYMVRLTRTKNSNFQEFFRKESDTYLDYGSIDKYTGSFTYSPIVTEDIPILVETVPTNGSWESPEYSGISSFGQLLYLKYMYTCTDGNAAVNINGNVFANVKKIEMRPMLRSQGNPYGSTNEVYTYYFAKGIGLIYARKLTGGFLTNEIQIRNWVVN